MLQSEIRSDEQLVWSDQPIPRPFSCGSIGLMVMGIPFTVVPLIGIGALSVTAFARSPAPMLGGCFSLFAIPFLLAGIGMLTSPIWISLSMKNSIYAITTQRVLLVRKGFFGRRIIQSYSPEQLTRMERTERPGGTGDLIFEQFTTHQGSSVSTVRRVFFLMCRRSGRLKKFSARRCSPTVCAACDKRQSPARPRYFGGSILSTCPASDAFKRFITLL